MILSYSIDARMLITILLICSLVVIFSLNLYIRHLNKKTSVIKTLSDAHILVLKEALGIDNLESIRIEHKRVKFLVKDVKKADLKLLKGFSTEGLFVKGKEITLTFEYEPEHIKKALENEV
ncbi:MAG: hypothetical protein RBQ91_01115 [Acholeplasma sp.]|nr:hypothetical protein [Acholeplasma sp.]